MIYSRKEYLIHRIINDLSLSGEGYYVKFQKYRNYVIVKNKQNVKGGYMIDIIELSPNESMIVDTTNNTVTIIILKKGEIRVINSANEICATLHEAYEMFTLPINSGKYIVSNTGTSAVKLFIVREFIY